MPESGAPAERQRARRAQALAARPAVVSVGRALVCLLGRSLRLSEVNRAGVQALWAGGGPVIYAAWHGRMLMLPYWYGRVRRLYVLASRSRDGELMSRFVAGFGMRPVRGSSSRGGALAIRILARVLRRDGADVAVVPDGPRGPRYVAQPGAVLLAKLSGAPIVPMGVGVSRGTVLGTWDAFVIPHPFARAVVVWGAPLLVPADADDTLLERCRERLEEALRGVTREADRAAGAPRASDL